MNVLFHSPSGALRRARALRWLEELGRAREACLVGATSEATDELSRVVTRQLGATYGWHRMTLGRLAADVSATTLAARGLAVASPLSIEALCVRVVRDTARGRLGRFVTIADRPGLPRALMRTIEEVRLGDVGTVPDPDLAALVAAYEEELARLRLADRATLMRTAIEIAATSTHPALGAPVLLYDTLIASRLDAAFVAALAARAGHALVTVPSGDELSLGHARAAFPKRAEESAESDEERSPASVASGLFAQTSEGVAPKAAIAIMSAPGESRECVEIARRILEQAQRGVPFDKMAVLLRAPVHYRAPLEEALRRAGIPACFARGTLKPDPTGRAMLSLLACAAEGLSARRFAEYLSLGEVPAETDDGAPPSALPSADRWVPPDEELVFSAALAALAPSDEEPEPRGNPDEDAVVAGSLRAPRLWERLLIDAAVIGGLDRWLSRLDALEREREADLRQVDDPDGPEAKRIRREIEGLGALRAYALPLLADLDALPKRGTWAEWIDRLTALATRALSRPSRVLSVLAELHPMANVSNVTLTDVRLALERRLTELSEPAPKRRFGHVYVASIGEARGFVFDVVFVPGLAERLFPQKVTEDPLLLDALREKVMGLRTNVDRTSEERLMLRLAVGSAERSLVLSYPRIDVEHGRPRTPSFYGLEVLRAAEGTLPGFGELAERAQRAGAARIGWPAPSAPSEAIDEAEHDLALLEQVLSMGEKEGEGRARYLLNTNEHLARALRFRGRRWNVRKWNAADGLVDPTGAAREALDKHLLTARTYSPTALQNFAQCPYKFFLYAVHKLAPREEPFALEELDPLQRGSLVHDVQFALYGKLREVGLLPVRADNLERARAKLDDEVDRVAAEYAAQLAPVIRRVWDDAIAQIKSDLRELMRRMAEDASWTPAHFELSFGLADTRGRDAASIDEGVPLDCGIQLRGSIDLVERSGHGTWRVTDYKTGKQQAKDGVTIGGGKVLQPVLYALVVEKLLPHGDVESGRLYYCTSTGGFHDVTVPLDDRARAAAALVSRAVGEALHKGFLPAAPDKEACKWCDYRSVCGPYEETRAEKHKVRERLELLTQLRKHP